MSKKHNKYISEKEAFYRLDAAKDAFFNLINRQKNRWGYTMWVTMHALSDGNQYGEALRIVEAMPTTHATIHAVELLHDIIKYERMAWA